jgi:hypothetical protein
MTVEFLMSNSGVEASRRNEMRALKTMTDMILNEDDFWRLPANRLLERRTAMV